MQMARRTFFRCGPSPLRRRRKGWAWSMTPFSAAARTPSGRDTISQCAAAGYDGLLLSHGGQNYAYTFLKALLAQYPALKIVTFGHQFKDSSGQTQTLEGVDPVLPAGCPVCPAAVGVCVPAAVSGQGRGGRGGHILKVWVGPNFLSPFDRRQEGYAAYEEAGLIHTVETIGPSDFSNAEASMADITTATPGQIPAGGDRRHLVLL